MKHKKRPRRTRNRNLDSLGRFCVLGVFLFSSFLVLGRFFLKISFVCCFRQRLDCQWLVHVCVYIPYPCTYTKPHRDRGIKQSKEAAGKSERNKKQPEWVWPGQTNRRRPSGNWTSDQISSHVYTRETWLPVYDLDDDLTCCSQFHYPIG
jgi:hypothetical protein